MLNYTIEHEWKTASSTRIMRELQAFNVDFIGTDNPKKLSIIVTDDEHEIVAGLLGETKWNWMYISWVWVHQTCRGQGVGTRLMRDAEREALSMGCDYTHLTTLDFQARVFYEKLGYEVFAALDNYPRGHTRFLMKKAIG
jgi:ribosomal protein S18 acetylase RimI-like enzyme